MKVKLKKSKSRIKFKNPKPPTPGWKYGKLTEEQRKDAREDLLHSPRGALILGQAFAIAYAELKDTEPSNAEDLALIAERMAGFFYAFYLSKLKVSDGRNGYSE